LSTYAKIFILMLSGVVLLVLGFISLILVSFSIPYALLNLYFQNITIIVFIMLFIGIGLWLFIPKEDKVCHLFGRTVFFSWPKILFQCYAGFMLLVTFVGVGIFAYEHNIHQVRLLERGIELYDYQPFRNRPLLARLDSPASYQMSQNVIRLDGATALYPMYAAFVEAVYPSGEYSTYNSSVQCSQTQNAYQRLISRDTDVIFVAGPSNLQLQMAATAGVEFELIPIGKEAFVFFTHENNPVSSLTLDQIKAIYSGEITRWSQVGGSNVAIEAFQRVEGSGSQTALQRLMGTTPLMTPNTELVVSGMGGILNQTAQYRNQSNAIGFSFRYYAMQLVNVPGLKYLSINDVAPSKDSIRDGTYPITSNFYAIYLKDNTHPELQSFINWILSDEGQTLIERTGYVSLH
jgi:phosphate transport system substrate-binding protein